MAPWLLSDDVKMPPSSQRHLCHHHLLDRCHEISELPRNTSALGTTPRSGEEGLVRFVFSMQLKYIVTYDDGYSCS